MASGLYLICIQLGVKMFNLDNQNRYLKIYILELTNVYATDDCVNQLVVKLNSEES